MILKGSVHKYNKANIDTDVIIPGPYLKIHDHDELAKHAMEGIDSDFTKKVSTGDFLLVGHNFGCCSRSISIVFLSSIFSKTFSSISIGSRYPPSIEFR